MSKNDHARMLITRNWRDAGLVAVGSQLLDLCDAHEPPFTVLFGADRAGGFLGSSLNNEKRLISIASETETNVRRSPEAMLVSLAHEVGHMFDPPTSADQRIVPNSIEHRARVLEREHTAWQWASSFLQQTSIWSRVEPVFAESRAVAIARYERLGTP